MKLKDGVEFKDLLVVGPQANWKTAFIVEYIRDALVPFRRHFHFIQIGPLYTSVSKFVRNRIFHRCQSDFPGSRVFLWCTSLCRHPANSRETSYIQIL